MPIEIHVILADNGQLTVSGAIQNKAMAYGLLELAKDAIRAQEMPKSGIIPVRHLPGNGPRPA